MRTLEHLEVCEEILNRLCVLYSIRSPERCIKFSLRDFARTEMKMGGKEAYLPYVVRVEYGKPSRVEIDSNLFRNDVDLGDRSCGAVYWIVMSICEAVVKKALIGGPTEKKEKPKAKPYLAGVSRKLREEHEREEYGKLAWRARAGGKANTFHKPPEEKKTHYVPAKLDEDEIPLDEAPLPYRAGGFKILPNAGDILKARWSGKEKPESKPEIIHSKSGWRDIWMRMVSSICGKFTLKPDKAPTLDLRSGDYCIDENLHVYREHKLESFTRKNHNIHPVCTSVTVELRGGAKTFTRNLAKENFRRGVRPGSVERLEAYRIKHSTILQKRKENRAKVR